MAQLTVAGDDAELARLAADRLTQIIEDAVAERGTALVSLAGGTTPRALYASLADSRSVRLQPDHTAHPLRNRIPWEQVHLFWSDERHVPPEHPDSNYGMAKAALIDHVPIPASHVHRIHGEMTNASDAAADYERTLTVVESGFRRIADAATPPLVASAFRRKDFFDLMLLGLGEDAHIASIFPGSELLNGGHPFTGRRTAAVWAPHLNAWRMTLTPQAILASRTIVVLVAGVSKADAVHSALEAPLDVKAHPAQLLRTAGDRVEWFLDRAAASRL